MSRLEIIRRSSESEAKATLRQGPRDPELKAGMDTPLAFLNHMLETLAWRSCLNLGVSIRTFGYPLAHVLCEDAGLTLGEALRQYVDRMGEQGINGSGAAVSGIDEALARVFVAFEDRALSIVEPGPVVVPERVEDMLSADLAAFLEGLAQGGRATLHVDMLRGRDPHHIWEAVFRALGESLREVFGPCPWRARTTAGVKGRVAVEQHWFDS